ncbi:MAG: hypothetical protein HY973_00965 [Candidatus Kerfeldbacteria bacterium]|nr:hypothetical protein [Candidatus Kerfeldbacteria bacterium]
MSERIGESVWPLMAKETINRTKLADIFEQGGFKAAGEYFLDITNTKINYRSEKSADFAEQRQKLQTEAGLIICNHPGYVEIPAILQALDRRDVKIMINRHIYEEFCQQFGEQYFVPNAQTPRELVEIMNQAISHIKNGGAFLLFPTGGEKLDVYNGKDKPKFMGGFRNILSRLSADNMIYSFYVDPEQSYQMRRSKVPTFAGIASEVISKGNFNINQSRDQQIIKVDERYTQADFWQSLLRQTKDKHEQDKLLASAYFNQIEEIE